MTTELIHFAKKYSRLLNFFNIFVALAPLHFRPAFIFRLGRWLNPFNLYADKFIQSIKLGLPEYNAQDIWKSWLDNHSRFLFDFLTYRKLDIIWLKKKVHFSDELILKSLQHSGGLLLTYHTYHQNTMCCMLGLKGIKVSAVAAPPDDSPLFPYLGDWATRVNTDSSIKFNGGKYIFTNNLRTLLNDTRECLDKGEVVVSLCDFHQPKIESTATAVIFDRSISPPTGIIEIALKQKVPIFLAFFAPSMGKYILQIKQLTDSENIDTVVSQYFSFLESNIRANPACWQGWEWFKDLPQDRKVSI